MKLSSLSFPGRFRLPLRYHPKSAKAKIAPRCYDEADPANQKHWLEYCAIRASAGNAFLRLKQRANPDRQSANGLFKEHPILAVAYNEGTIETPHARRLLACVARDGSNDLFVKLGRILSEAKRRKPRATCPPDTLDALLVHHWIDPDNDAPDLCLFTDDALAALAAIVLDDEDIEAEAVTKARQRLQLVKAVRVPVRFVRIEGGKILAR